MIYFPEKKKAECMRNLLHFHEKIHFYSRSYASCAWSHLWIIGARWILALSTGEQNLGSMSVGGTPMTGPLPTGSSLARPITELWWWGGRALPVTQIWIRCLRWYKTNPGLVFFGSSSGKKSAHSGDSRGRLTSHFGHITDLIRDKWSGARSLRCLCRLAWQTWLLHRFICLWFSHHSGRGQGWTHTENRSLLFWSVSKITVVFKPPSLFVPLLQVLFEPNMLKLSYFH